MIAKSALPLDPVTLGWLLWAEFMSPMRLTRYRPAKEIGLPAPRVGDIVRGKRSVTADTDLRLCRFFGLSDGYWLRAQAAFDIEVARRKIALELTKITTWTSTAACPQKIVHRGYGPAPGREVLARLSLVLGQ